MGIGKRIEQDIPRGKSNVKSDTKRKGEQIFIPETPKFTFDDIILPNAVKEQILDVAEYTCNSKIVFEDWGLAETHKYSKRMGINLYGPSGTGKTMAAHAIANYLNRQILSINYADIESKYVGETPKNIRKAFETAKAANSVLFFDEADAILSRRVTNMTNATDVSVNQTRSVMLMMLNDYQDIIIFATNFIENYDSAFMRRIARHVKFDLPDYECRLKLWELYIPKRMPNNIDIDKLSKKYSGLSGSDISNAILMAAFKAVRSKSASVSQEYVEETVESIISSKQANRSQNITIEKKVVTEEYAKKMMKQ